MELASRWLSPQGELKTYVGLSHAYSEAFVIREVYKIEKPKKLPPYFYLEERGWIRLSDFGFFDELKFIINKGRSLNTIQKKFIKDWCIENKREYKTVIYKIK